MTEQQENNWEGITPRKQNVLIRQALRWNTEATGEELERAMENRASLKEQALKVIFENLQSDNARVRIGAVRALLQMEKMNQEDQKPTRSIDVAIGHKSDRVIAIAAELGLDGFIEENDAGEPEGSSGESENDTEAEGA